MNQKIFYFSICFFKPFKLCLAQNGMAHHQCCRPTNKHIHTLHQQVSDWG